jgi:hypothetical protein
MYDFDRGRHWSDATDDEGSSGMGWICDAYLDGEGHGFDVHCRGGRDYRALRRPVLDGGGHRIAS